MAQPQLLDPLHRQSPLPGKIVQSILSWAGQQGLLPEFDLIEAGDIEGRGFGPANLNQNLSRSVGVNPAKKDILRFVEVTAEAIASATLVNR